MKKLTLAATALAVAAALAGCGREADDAATTASTTAPSTTAPSTTAPSSSDTGSSTATAPSGAMGSSTATAPAAGTTDASSSSTVASASPAGTDPAASAGGTAAMGAAASGQTVYTNACAMCHAAGVTGAPKPGDKTDWQPRIAQGKDTLYEHAIKGYQGKKGMMPPKGGNTSLPDADVKAAVDFMVTQSQ